MMPSYRMLMGSVSKQVHIFSLKLLFSRQVELLSTPSHQVEVAKLRRHHSLHRPLPRQTHQIHQHHLKALTRPNILI